mgnify:FL=1
MAVTSLAAFGGAVAAMAVSLATGLQVGLGSVDGGLAIVANLLLVAQFPLLHSWLLGARGRHVVARLSPFGHGRTLASSTYALITSLQLLLVFGLWTPSGIVWHTPTGWLGAAQWIAFVLAWAFLGKAMHDAGLGLQTGAAGWLALWRRHPVDYGGMPTDGLFRACRQPIYLGFGLVLLTAPTWSLDWLLLAGGWLLYCVLGPLHKEARWLRHHGSKFAAYKATVPYLLPRLWP